MDEYVLLHTVDKLVFHPFTFADEGRPRLRRHEQTALGSPVGAEQNAVDVGRNEEVFEHDHVFPDNHVQQTRRKFRFSRDVREEIFQTAREIRLFEMTAPDRDELVGVKILAEIFPMLEGALVGAVAGRVGKKGRCFFGRVVFREGMPAPPRRADVEHTVADGEGIRFHQTEPPGLVFLFDVRVAVAFDQLRTVERVAFRREDDRIGNPSLIFVGKCLFDEFASGHDVTPERSAQYGYLPYNCRCTLQILPCRIRSERES